jgi:PAS domain S-box-containing protein
MRPPASLLLITGAGDDSLPVVQELNRGLPALEILPVAAASILEEALQKPGFDVALVDGQLPWADWEGIVRLLKERAPHCPVILLADSRQVEAACAAVSLGLDDYVVKSGDHWRRLPRAVQTAWRRAELSRQRLEDAEAGYRAIFDASNEVMLVQDPETGQILDANREACDRIGYTVEELRRLSIADLSLAEEPYTQREAMRLIRTAAAGESPQFEWLGRDRKGRLHWVEMQLKSISLQGQARVLSVSHDISVHKRSQEALHESEHRYQTLLHSAGNAIFIHDPDGRILEVNRAAGEILGYTQEELLQMSLPDLEVPLGSTPLQERVSYDFRPSQKLVELGLRRRDGLTLPVEMSSRIIEYAGLPVILSIARDISARRQAEEALRLSEEKYRTIFENTGTAMAIIEEDTRFCLVNSEFARLSGYSPEELQGKKSWTEFVSEADLARMQEYHRRRRIDPGPSHPGEHGDGAGTPGSGPPVAAQIGPGPQGLPPCHRPGEADPGLQPPGGTGIETGGLGPGSARMPQAAARLLAQHHRNPGSTGGRGRSRAGGCHPDPAGVDQPVHQCRPCPAGPGRLDGSDSDPRGSRCLPGSAASGPGSRSISEPEGARYRPRHGFRRHEANF